MTLPLAEIEAALNLEGVHAWNCACEYHGAGGAPHSRVDAFCTTRRSELAERVHALVGDAATERLLASGLHDLQLRYDELWDEAEAYKIARDRLAEQVTGLREALRRYGKHEEIPRCPAASFRDGSCTCGLITARAGEGTGQ